MGDRPPRRESELSVSWKKMQAQPNQSPAAPAYLSIYEQAKLQQKWIYDPQLKRWQSPEEFLENEKRYSGGEPDRLSRLQVRDPMEGIKASYVQLQDLKERMEIFVQRVLDYYKERPGRS